MFEEICKKLKIFDYRRFRWFFWIFYLSVLSIFIFVVYIDKFFYNPAKSGFDNIYRFLWVLPFSFMGFSFLAFMISKHFPDKPDDPAIIDKIEKDRPWKSYNFHYFPRLIALSLIIFSVLHLFDHTSGYIYYFLSAGLGLYFGYNIEIRIEDILKKNQ